MICTRVIHMANGDQDNAEHFIGTSAKCAEESTRTRREVGHRCYWRDLLASSCRSNRSMKTRIASGALLLSRPGMGGFYTNGASDGNAELRKGVPALRTSNLRFRSNQDSETWKGFLFRDHKFWLVRTSDFDFPVSQQWVSLELLLQKPAQFRSTNCQKTVSLFPF